MIKRDLINSFSMCFVMFFLSSLMGCVGSCQLVKVEPSEGVTQAFILITPEKPVASVILFAGGHGQLELTGGSSMRWGEKNFLVNSRYLFAAKGIQVAVIDAPYNQFGYMSLNRRTEEHRNNVKAVAKYMREKANVPIWLVGTSRGTVSVANIAINDPEHYDGAVFTSTVLDAVYENASEINLPTLVVHHSNDQCVASNPWYAETLYEKLVNAKPRKILWFSGGYTAGDVCGPMSFHGYLGIEQKVVDAIVEFILSQSGSQISMDYEIINSL